MANNRKVRNLSFSYIINAIYFDPRVFVSTLIISDGQKFNDCLDNCYREYYHCYWVYGTKVKVLGKSNKNNKCLIGLKTQPGATSLAAISSISKTNRKAWIQPPPSQLPPSLINLSPQSCHAITNGSASEMGSSNSRINLEVTRTFVIVLIWAPSFKPKLQY